MAKTPKSESNAVTAMLRNFKNVPNTGKNTPNNLPPKTQDQGITVSQDILGGDVAVGDTFLVSAVNPDGTVTLVKQASAVAGTPAGATPTL